MLLTKCSLGPSESKNSYFPQELAFKKFVYSQQKWGHQEKLGERTMAYCPFVWMFYSLLINNKINHFQERHLQIIYNYKASSFKELPEWDREWDGNVTIHIWNLQILRLKKLRFIKVESCQFWLRVLVDKI